MDDMIQQGREVVESGGAPIWTLDELMEQMAVETFHEVEDTGPAIGREVW